MPGSTNNTILISAANQIIAALNDLSGLGTSANQIVEALNQLSNRIAPEGHSLYEQLANLNEGGVTGDLSDVVKALRIMTVAISAEALNLETGLPDEVDYITTGLAVRLAPTNESSIATRLQNIYQKLQDMELYINELEEMQHAISSVLGYTPRELD